MTRIRPPGPVIVRGVRVWGIHGLPRSDFIALGAVMLERPGSGDLARLGNDRAALKRRLAGAYPLESAGTVAAWAGVLRRFAFEPEVGDLVVHPDRRSRTLSVGRIASDYQWKANGGSDMHVRRVTWLRTRLPRDRLSAQARAAISARVAFFEIKRATHELTSLTRG